MTSKEKPDSKILYRVDGNETHLVAGHGLGDRRGSREDGVFSTMAPNVGLLPSSSAGEDLSQVTRRDTGYVTPDCPSLLELSTLGDFVPKTSSRERPAYDDDDEVNFAATDQLRTPKNVTFSDDNRKGRESRRLSPSSSADSLDGE